MKKKQSSGEAGESEIIRPRGTQRGTRRPAKSTEAQTSIETATRGSAEAPAPKLKRSTPRQKKASSAVVAARSPAKRSKAPKGEPQSVTALTKGAIAVSPED